MQWRAAVKKFIPQPLSDAQMNDVLEMLRLAPSSFGLQPFKFIVVTNPDVRAKLRAAEQVRIRCGSDDVLPHKVQRVPWLRGQASGDPRLLHQQVPAHGRRLRQVRET